MKVSIIIPVYNVEKYIERCILSVVNQTYSNIECIIVDDCSPDNSIAEAEKLILSYTGTISFEILHHEKNRGLSAGRNTGTKHAKGQYIYYLDSDDEITPQCIELLIFKSQTDKSIEIIQGNTLCIPPPPDSNYQYNISKFGLPQAFRDNESIRKWFYDTSHPIPINAWNKLVKLDFIRINNLYFKEGIIHEDEHWMFFVVKHLNHIAFIEDMTYVHYITSDSIMRSSNQKKSISNISIILYDFCTNFDDILYDGQFVRTLQMFIPRYVKYPHLNLNPQVYEILCKEARIHHNYYYLAILYIATVFSRLHKGTGILMKLIRLRSKIAHHLC